MAKDKCNFCNNDGDFYKDECSNAVMMYMPPDRIILQGSIPATASQTLFIAVPCCPICGREFRGEKK
jgi:hypothetical protein